MRAKVSSTCCLDATAPLDEMLGVLSMKGFALLEPGGNCVVDGHVLAVERHLPRYLRAHGAGARGGDLRKGQLQSP